MLKRFTRVRLLIAAFAALGALAGFSRGEPLPTIRWDKTSLRLIEQGGDYGRMVRLSDGSVACAYDRGGKMWVRHSKDGGSTFDEPVLVAAERDCSLTNASLLPLRDGTLLYFWNERPVAAIAYEHKPAPPGVLTRPFLIRMSRSGDGGTTWSVPQTLYTAGPNFQDGCWEPAAIQLPSGEIQVYFANEAPYTTTGEQEISLLRSGDEGKTWGPAERVSLRKDHRDGMPSPLVLANDRGIAVAIEDNGLDGDRFKPAIVSTPLKENWQVGAERHAALATPLDRRWYAGAPFLVQLPSGVTLLSYQEGAEGTMRHCRMAVCVGSDDARGFTNKTYPLPEGGRGGQLWNSLFVKDATTVTAVLTTTVDNVNGIYAIDGHVVATNGG